MANGLSAPPLYLTPPSLAALGDHIVEETLDAIEKGLVELGAFTADYLSEKEKPLRRNLLLLYWILYHNKLEESIKLDAIP